MEAVAAVREYLAGVASGEIVAGENIRLACERSQAELDGQCPEVYWDAGELENVASFVAKLRLHDWGNEQAKLWPWQLHLAGCLLCRRWRADDLLATKQLCLEIGKGNGKSTLAAMLSLYLLTTSPSRIEIWSMATKRDQAHRITENAGNFARGNGMVEPDGPIKVRFRELYHSKTFSLMGSLATKERTADGLLPRLALADECGRYGSDDTLGKLAIALHKLPAAQLLMFTTPGSNRENTYYLRRDRMEQELRAGELPRDQVPLLYGIDSTDDPFDETTWSKANPMLAVGLMNLRSIQGIARESAGTQNGRAEFTREICCRFDDRDAVFIDLALFDECKRDFSPAEMVKKSDGRVSVGLDLSKNHDLTAAVCSVLVGQDVYQWCHAWTCTHEIEQRERLSRMPFRKWAEDGWMTICDGDTIDLATVADTLRRWCDEFPVWRIYVDPVSGSADTLEQWKQGGLPITAHKQNRFEMSPPLQKFNTLVRQARAPKQPHLFHDGSPVYRQCVRNARVETDHAGNITAGKDVADGLVDMLHAGTMSLTGIMAQIREPKSFYSGSSII